MTDLSKLSDAALQKRIDKLRSDWSAEYARIKTHDDYRDLKRSEYEREPANSPLRKLRVKLDAIDAEETAAVTHQENRKRYGSSYARQARWL